MHRGTETVMISSTMADGVHPRDADSFSSSSGQVTRTTTTAKTADTTTSSSEHDPDFPATTTAKTATANAPLSPGKLLPSPPPGTYVIQIPKDQVYHVPPPENVKRFEHLSRRKPQRNGCCSCLCLFFAIIVLLLLAVGISAATLYLIFRPESPNYSVESISIKGFNLTSSAPISPEFDVSVRADNPNDKIGIYYRTGSSVKVYYDDVGLSSGSLPSFYQGPNNVTVFQTALKGSSIEFTVAVRNALLNGERKGTVPFRLDLRVPVKLKIGAVKTWTITVKVNCDVRVNKLTANAKIVSKNCQYGADLW